MSLVVRGFVFLVVGLALVGVLAQPAWATHLTAAQLQALACGANADQLNAGRVAAGQLLAVAWSDIAGNAQQLPSATLNAAIVDGNAECREAAIDSLAQRLLEEGAPFNAAKIQQTHDSANGAVSLQQGIVRARVALELVRAGIFERGAPEGFARMETIAGGGKFNLRGVNVDGSIAGVRTALSRYFLTGAYRFFGGLVFGDAKTTCDTLRDKARNGASAEIRDAAASAYVAGVVVDRKETKCVASDGLVQATLKGSAAVQAAVFDDAAAVLAANSKLSNNALVQLSTGETGRDVQAAGILCTDPADETTCEKVTTSSLRLAAAYALGLRFVAEKQTEAFVRVFSLIHQTAGFKELPLSAVPALRVIYAN